MAGPKSRCDAADFVIRFGCPRTEGFFFFENRWHLDFGASTGRTRAPNGL
jgi:hypothetical protein